MCGGPSAGTGGGGGGLASANPEAFHGGPYGTAGVPNEDWSPPHFRSVAEDRRLRHSLPPRRKRSTSRHQAQPVPVVATRVGARVAGGPSVSPDALRRSFVTIFKQGLRIYMSCRHHINKFGGTGHAGPFPPNFPFQTAALYVINWIRDGCVFFPKVRSPGAYHYTLGPKKFRGAKMSCGASAPPTV